MNKYFKELEFRLNFLIDNKSGITSRIRCLRTISLCAVQLMLAGNSQLLDFIIEYCIKVFFNINHFIIYFNFSYLVLNQLLFDNIFAFLLELFTKMLVN